FFKIVGLGIVGVLEVGIVAFLLRAEDALQLPFGRLLYGDLSPIASGTRFGTAFIAMTLGFALVAALVFLAWLLESRVLLWAGFYLSVLRLPHVSDLWTQGYGHVLLVKLALVCLALGWGGLHHTVARPRVERDDGRVLGILPRSLLGEASVGMAVLLAAAVLV